MLFEYLMHPWDSPFLSSIAASQFHF